MSIEKAKAHLEKFGLSDRVLEFSVSSATVALAAEAIGCREGEIAKTLSFAVDGGAILIVAAGDAKIDNGKYKAAFSTKAKMLQFEEVEPLIGHAVGGVCPFGVNEGVPVYLDCSLKRYSTVYPAAGSSQSAVRLSLSELETASGCVGWVDVCKDPV